MRTAAPLVVRDAREDDLTKGLAVVKSGKALAYLGVPLTLASGFVIGTLCVADVKPRAWTREDTGVLTDLARCVLTEIGRRADAEARRQAETELQRTADRLRGLLDHSPAMILGRDLEGRDLFVNRAGERALGMPEDAAIGKLGAQALRAHDDAVIAAGAPLEVEETLELEGGTVLLRSVKFPLTDEAGEPYGVCAICTEVAAPAAAAAEMPSEVNLGLGLGELSSAKALLRRLETAVDAAQSALSTALPE